MVRLHRDSTTLARQVVCGRACKAAPNGNGTASLWSNWSPTCDQSKIPSTRRPEVTVDGKLEQTDRLRLVEPTFWPKNDSGKIQHRPWRTKISGVHFYHRDGERAFWSTVSPNTNPCPDCIWKRNVNIIVVVKMTKPISLRANVAVKFNSHFATQAEQAVRSSTLSRYDMFTGAP
ncbi:hypothetical protein Tsp_03292 [Trichinella spiralis]|uniref:hypothetical protein n=1 Tax=Trichinella spiralis TaxID=6334 RepID=UPI0001EFC5AF|nr:hypothetical protein Tsp_03292 [Trichinella spiralis]